jgi:hypothetical protein
LTRLRTVVVLLSYSSSLLASTETSPSGSTVTSSTIGLQQT